MSFFATFLEQLLGPGWAVDLTIAADGTPTVRLSLADAALAGSLALEPGSLVIDGDFAEETEAAILDALGEHGHRLRQLHDYADRFPVRVERGDTLVLVSLAEPRWHDAGLSATVVVSMFADGVLERGMEMDMVVAARADLDPGGWEERLSAFSARVAAWGDRFLDLSELDPEEARLVIPEPPPPVEDEGWPAYAERLGMDREATAARVSPAIEAALGTLATARARYREVFGLLLPSGLAAAAALISALGALPENPEDHAWEPDPGWERGCAWLDAALGMRACGLSAWFSPGGLSRSVLDASAADDEVPPGCEGRLDPRLDWRFRLDAPQLVTFLGGDSDGLHWGFWYDSPQYAPLIAANYARDDAVTWLDEGATVVAWLRGRLAKGLGEVEHELSEETDEEMRGYSQRRWRALRVVGAHLELIGDDGRFDERDVPCPWPRTAGSPLGSPSLALPPGAGAVPEHLLALGGGEDRPSVDVLRGWMEEARRELLEGKAGYAMALGLYLHWLDGDELREAAGALLEDAYEALGFRAFAEVLRVHLRWRDLRSVAVYEG